MKRTSLLALMLATAFSSLAQSTVRQSPYKLSWKTDGIIVGTAGALIGGSILANRNMQALTPEEIKSLDPRSVNGFDRWAIGQHSNSAGARSNIGLLAPIGLGMASTFVLPAINKDRSPYRSQFSTLMVMWLETNLVNFGGTELVKSTVKRIRPHVYQDGFVDEELGGAYVDSRKSFFSGHTSIAAANTFFMAKVFSDYYPDSKWKPLVWTAAAAIPAWTGLERVLAGKHFPTDVITGYLFGAACGYFIPHFHKVKEPGKELSVRVMPFANRDGQGASVIMNF